MQAIPTEQPAEKHLKLLVSHVKTADNRTLNPQVTEESVSYMHNKVV